VPFKLVFILINASNNLLIRFMAPKML